MAKSKASKSSSAIPKHLIIVGAVLIVLAIVFVVLIVTENKPESIDNREAPIANNAEKDTGKADTNGQEERIFNPETDSIETVANLDTAIATTAGSNLITEDGKVVNEIGQVVKNNALPMSPIAPRLSEPLDPNYIIDGVIKITANEDGFSPSEFTVISGEPVTLSLTSEGVDSRLVFKNISLIALEIPVLTDTTMSKTFNAPQAGEYIFYQDMPGKTNQTGKMIVVDSD
jgi:hypothetical protein